MKTKICIVALSLLAASTAMADSIVVDGVEYTGVYIRESPSTYYVQIPEQGSVRRVSKSSVEPGDVVFSESEEERAALLALWRRNNEAQDKARGLLPYSAPTRTAAARPVVLKSSALPSVPEKRETPIFRGVGRRAVAPAPPLLVAQSRTTRIGQASLPARGARSVSPFAQIVSNGDIQTIDLRDVPLRDALAAMLRPMSLDYAIQNGILWISTPERVDLKSVDELETRFYAMQAGSDTLPKIVINNPGGPRGFAAGGAFGGGGGGFGGGGQGGGGAGGGGFGGQGGGGFGGQGGGGGGGFGGQGGGGFGGGGAAFTNISQLFTNINDLLVGERPNLITQMFGAGGGGGGFGGQGGGGGGFGGQR